MRMKAEVRKDQIMDAAIKLAEQVGYNNLTRADIAIAANTSPALVSRYWGTMNQARSAVMRHAVNTENLKVITQGLACDDHQALKASKDLKQQAIQSLYT